MSDHHRLSIRSDGPNPISSKVELDGHQVHCSRLELVMDANEMVSSAVITIPLVHGDIDIPADITVIRPGDEDGD